MPVRLKKSGGLAGFVSHDVFGNARPPRTPPFFASSYPPGHHHRARLTPESDTLRGEMRAAFAEVLPPIP